VADEILDGTDMIGELLGERKRVTHQPGNALSQSVGEEGDWFSGFFVMA
jgi:hypothetical protein